MAKKLQVKDLADQINSYIDNYEYFGAYGLLKDSIKLWDNPDSYKLLGKWGKVMVMQARGYLEN